jgi:hypothetical protein
MNKETFFFTLFVIWYFNKYGPPQKLVKLYYCAIEFLNLYKDYYLDNIEEQIDNPKLTSETNYELKPEPKYEDKYLNEIRKLDKEFKLNEEEKQLQIQQFMKFHILIMKEEYFDKLKINKDKLHEIKIKIKKYKSLNDNSYLDETNKQRVNLLLQEQQNILNIENLLKQEYESEEGIVILIKKVQELSLNFVIKQKLKNNYVIEHTPLGNVMMIYDIECETFKYYSDNTIPYRYLEVVGRKYVKQFGCRPLFVDMEEELKLAEEKEKERKEKELKDEEVKRINDDIKKPIEEKKNVFAKFKSYNTEAGTGHVNTAAPPKNSIPNKKLTEKHENEKVLLKEKSNRYTYEGKFANFSFIKKIDRKVIDKKFITTFADFKKLQMKKLL